MINNPTSVLALRLRPAPSAASPCDSAGSQQSRTSPTLHSLPTCDCRDSLHADEPLLITQQWSMRDHLLTLEALVMKMMGRLPVLLQSSAAQGVRQWHKQTTCWFTCGSHRLPQIHPIEIQITKNQWTISNPLHKRGCTPEYKSPALKLQQRCPPASEAAARAAEDIKWRSVCVGWMRKQ